MSNIYTNPYSTNDKERPIWNILIKNDFEGFLNQSWETVGADFVDDGFFGIDFKKSKTAQDWKLTFPSLDIYKEKWVEDSLKFSKNKFIDNPREVLYSTTKLENFEFYSDFMMVHKVFDGEIRIENGSPIQLLWRSLFVLRWQKGAWKIASFTGYI